MRASTVTRTVPSSITEAGLFGDAIPSRKLAEFCNLKAERERGEGREKKVQSSRTDQMPTASQSTGTWGHGQ